MSGGCPLGAIVSASGPRWDVRGGVTDSSPARQRNVFGANRAPAASQVVVGGGVTPITGLRVGAAFARGQYRSPAVSQTGLAIPGARATVFTVEGEYAIGYTRISGEWIADP